MMDESNYNIRNFKWGRSLSLKDAKDMPNTVTVQKNLNSNRKWEEKKGVLSFVETNHGDTYYASYITNSRRLLISKNNKLVKRYDHISLEEANGEIAKLSVNIQVLDITPLR